MLTSPTPEPFFGEMPLPVSDTEKRSFPPSSEARMVIIPNTLEVNTLWVSPALEAEVKAHPHLSFETGFQPLPFSPEGFLDQETLFPESVRGRRAAGAAYAGH